MIGEYAESAMHLKVFGSLATHLSFSCTDIINNKAAEYRTIYRFTYHIILLNFIRGLWNIIAWGFVAHFQAQGLLPFNLCSCIAVLHIYFHPVCYPY